MTLFSFLRMQFSEPGGDPSNNRVLLALLVITMLALLVAAAAHNNWKLPEVPASLETFVEWMSCILVTGATLSKFAARVTGQ
jgi:hypothetical protein